MTKQELEMCIDKYGRDIYSFCKHLTNNTPEADDLYQDTFLTAVKLKEQIEYANNPKSYFLSIALRIWNNKKRKFAWRKRIADVQPEERITNQEKAEAIRTAVNRLPEKLKIVVLLFYMEDLSTAQIAETMRIPTGTVLSRLYQARKTLKKDLEDIYYG